MVKVCGGPMQQDAHLLAHVEVVLGAVPASITTWWGVVGAGPWPELEGGQLRVRGRRTVPRVGRPAGGDGLAVGRHELGVPR